MLGEGRGDACAAATGRVLLPPVDIDALLDEEELVFAASSLTSIVTRRCASTPQDYLRSRSLPFLRVHQIPDGRCYGVEAFHSTINWMSMVVVGEMMGYQSERKGIKVNGTNHGGGNRSVSRVRESTSVPRDFRYCNRTRG